MRTAERNGARARLCAAAVAAAALPAAVAGAQDAFPDGPARDTVVLVCSQCHPLTRILDSRKSAPEWEALLYDMVSRGATLYERELEPVRAYLADNFSTDAR